MSGTAQTPSAPAAEAAPTAGRLPMLDRLLPVWIAAAMAVGLVTGRAIPGLGAALDAVQADGVSLPIALGLLVMMYPVLARVRYDRLETVTADRRLLISSLILNWVAGPALMFTLAWIFLPGQAALAGVVGPLIEVPVLLALVYLSLALRRRLARPHRLPV